MNRNKKTYSFLNRLSAIFMILTLCWLTISMPFVIDFKEKVAKMENKSSAPAGQDDETAPLGNNTEEKVPFSNNSFSEEYLHDLHITPHYFLSETSQYHNCENTDIYIAFHGELLVPPPNTAS